jgi:hypothetical protein
LQINTTDGHIAVNPDDIGANANTSRGINNNGLQH